MALLWEPMIDDASCVVIETFADFYLKEKFVSVRTLRHLV